jgi:heterodisulfide reductase subunit C
MILPGDFYLEHVCSPDHDDIGNVGWWRAAECRECAERCGRGHLFGGVA